MADPWAILSVVSSIITLVDFGTELVAKTHEIYASTSGVTESNFDLEEATRRLSVISVRLQTDGAVANLDPGIAQLCNDCNAVAIELLCQLHKLRCRTPRRTLDSFRKAVLSVWKQPDLDRLSAKLQGFRTELTLHLTADVRSTLMRFAAEQRASNLHIEERLAQILSAIIKERVLFASQNLLATTDVATNVTEVVREEAEGVTSDIVSQIRQSSNQLQARTDSQTAQVIETVKEVNIRLDETIEAAYTEQQASDGAIRREIRILEASIAQLKQLVVEQTIVIKDLVQEAQRASAKKNQQKIDILKERSRATHAAVLAYRIIQDSLTAAVERLKLVLQGLLDVSTLDWCWRRMIPMDEVWALSPFTSGEARSHMLLLADPATMTRHWAILEAVGQAPPMERLPMESQINDTEQKSHIWLLACSVAALQKLHYSKPQIDRAIFSIDNARDGRKNQAYSLAAARGMLLYLSNINEPSLSILHDTFSDQHQDADRATGDWWKAMHWLAGRTTVPSMFFCGDSALRIWTFCRILQKLGLAMTCTAFLETGTSRNGCGTDCFVTIWQRITGVHWFLQLDRTQPTVADVSAQQALMNDKHVHNLMGNSLMPQDCGCRPCVEHRAGAEDLIDINLGRIERRKYALESMDRQRHCWLDQA